MCKNLDIFRRLCGDRAASGVRLVTTMWDQVKNRELAASMELQVVQTFWRPLIEAGARHKRFEENSSRCAWEIVEDLTGGGEPLLLQQELVDEERKLSETTAGQALYEQFQRLLHEQQETIEQLREEAKAQKDPELVKQLEVGQRRPQPELKKTRDDVDKRKVPSSKRIALCFSKKTHSNSAITVQFADIDEPPAFAENDYVIFLVGPTEAEKTSFIFQLWRTGRTGVGHPHSKNVRARRCKHGKGSNNIIIINTPSCHSDSHNFNAESRTTGRFESKFTQTCHAGVLFLHSLDSELAGGDCTMSWHLREFAMACHNRFTMPSNIYVVPTRNPVVTLSSDTLNQRLSQLKTMTEGLNGIGEHDWHVSIFPGVFKGQPETAWSAALLLLKSITQAQTNGFFASARPTLKDTSPKFRNARLDAKVLADSLLKEFKEKTRDCDLDAIITLRQTALEFTPLEHSERHSALVDLAGLLSQRFNVERRKEDLDELITLKRAASENTSPYEPQRQTILLELDDYLSERFRRTDSMVDLEEIISLRRAALEYTPPPNQCGALLNLADALHKQFQKKYSENSITEAIRLTQAALGLCPPGHRDHALSRCHLESYLTTTRLALNDVANPSFKEFKKKEKDSNLDATIGLGRTALEFTPPQHPQRLSVLNDLGRLLSERFSENGRKEDLEELFTLKHAMLECMSLDEPQRQSLLRELDDYFSERFKRTDSTVDLEEIISLRRASLEHTPQPNRCRALLNLANALHEQFQRQGAEESIDEAASLAQIALDLHPSGHPDHALSRNHLVGYLEAKVGEKASRAHGRGAEAGPSSSSSSDIKQLIKKAVSDMVEKIPLRLLHTPTGVLCDRDAQISRFEGSPEYQRLLSLASSLDNQQLETEIDGVISEYFEYATLSHRWGGGEPLLRDVQVKGVYNLSGADGEAKLQKFCLLALRRNFRWAWSDTCCIDKDSSAELQEAIGSMFAWYRWSSLTIVHLAGVSNTCSLVGSDWFTRGWTLQELLASRTILFYTSDWSLYLKSDVEDHKSDPTLLKELQDATGITIQHLTKFSPGMDDARARLHWASRRRTTRPEDIAYSLFGIFQVHLPIFYGESAQNALGRLLAEIISRSGDVSVLDWVGKPSSFNSCFPADLAPYQMVSHLQLIPSYPTRRGCLDLEKARKLYHELARLPRTGFVNSKLTLPSIVHPLTAVQLQVSSTNPSHYRYEIQASRLRPLNVTLSVKLIESADTYILVRPWHPKTLEQQADGDVDAVWKLLEHLEQPFNALLLKRSLRNEYQRIACDCTITARIQDITSILDSEVLIPEIV
ncbi:hypothetical protein EDD15DRAFT_1184908 [Pisolithus albus]|nr:hypothetical protein EDD15DRAFT_1184908 [Pisolithus albus]